MQMTESEIKTNILQAKDQIAQIPICAQLNRVNELTAQREAINAELLTIKAELVKIMSAIDGGEDNEQI